jgi:hypothetical protein
MSAGLPASLSVLIVTLALTGSAGRTAEVEKYLPDNTEAVLVVNVRQIVEAPVFQKVLHGLLGTSLEDNPDTRPLGAFLRDGGLKDLSRLVVAFPPGQPERKGMIIIRGRFDLARLKPLAEALAQNTPITLKIQPADKVPLYEILIDDPPTADLFAAFPEEGVLVVSPSRDTALDAIAKGAGRRTTRLNKDFQTLLDGADAKQSIWVAGRIPEQVKKNLAERSQLKPFAGKMLTFQGGIRVAEGVKATFSLQMADEQAATDLRQMLDLAKGLANLYIANTPSLKNAAPVITEVLESAQFTRRKTLVSLELTVSADQIEKGVKPAPNP